MSRTLALSIVNPGSVPSMPYAPCATQGIIPEDCQVWPQNKLNKYNQKTTINGPEICVNGKAPVWYV